MSHITKYYYYCTKCGHCLTSRLKWNHCRHPGEPKKGCRIQEVVGEPKYLNKNYCRRCTKYFVGDPHLLDLRP
ncbi:hypothetical protein FSOLCH5_008162 [Fusarium solani]